MSFTQKDLLEMSEAASMDVAVNVQARWQRKALAARATPAKGAKTPGAKTPAADRFIACRSAMNFEAAGAALSGLNTSRENVEEEGFKADLAANLIGEESRVLAMKAKAPAPADGHVNSLKVLYSQNNTSVNGGSRVKTYRHIPSGPERILDAPEMLDDYYLNLLDWGSNNTVAIALGQAVFLWNATTGTINELCRTKEDDNVTSVSWIKEGGAGYIAVGTNSSEIQLWDAERGRQVRSMKGHSARVGAMDWNAHILSSGSRDTSIIHHDVRIKEHAVATLQGHSQEVCGLKWSPDGTMLASGGNDNLLCVWDNATTSISDRVQTPRYTLAEHQAAVKALAWCPWQKGVLATGGGTADRSIKVWNAATGTLCSTVDTGSQVCSLLWNPHERELLSSHGFSQNQLCLWKFPTMQKVKELTGHTARVLHMAASPDGTTVVSAGADETLRFWRVFGEPAKKAVAGAAGAGPAAPAGLIPGLNIR